MSTVNPKSKMGNPTSEVALLTGGGDRPYVYGLVGALVSKGISPDVIGSDELDFPEFRGNPRINFLNLRGSVRTDASVAQKLFRVLRYYARLVRYAATARPRIFHILWNNKLEVFDRTVLLLFYKILGKRIVLTVHNVNSGKRDGNDSGLNRITLRIQYKLADHIFVHTEKMRVELIRDFGVNPARVTVIPFGINNSVPTTTLTAAEAKQRLGICNCDNTVLFFGRITPYKGLEYLVCAVRQLLRRRADYRLIIAGRPDRCDVYWNGIREAIQEEVKVDRVVLRAEHVPDEETEVYFKAADVLVLPYRDIYQSGVLVLGQSFGLPVIAADVGMLKDEIVEGKTGFVFRPEDSDDLARTIERYFASDLYANLDSRRKEIQKLAARRHSWGLVSEIIVNVYANLLRDRHEPVEAPW